MPVQQSLIAISEKSLTDSPVNILVVCCNCVLNNHAETIGRGHKYEQLTFLGVKVQNLNLLEVTALKKSLIYLCNC